MPHKFKFLWRRPAVKRVTAARDFRLPRLFANTYPGCWIGLSLYYRHDGLALLWGRPGGIKK
jgi:hypothetical protein